MSWDNTGLSAIVFFLSGLLQVQGLGFRVWGLGFGVWGTDLRVEGVGFNVNLGLSGLGFRV